VTQTIHTGNSGKDREWRYHPHHGDYRHQEARAGKLSIIMLVIIFVH